MKEYEKWLLNTKSEILHELHNNKDNIEYINDIFRGKLKFGTSGLRAKMGAGSNRLNIYTIAHATQSVCEYILKHTNNKTVVIGYDGRNNSYEFAKTSASIFIKNGIKVYMFNEYTATPVLSFATKHLKTYFGIMITASHNPPIYNGYKVYNEYGAQISVDTAKEIMNIMKNNDIFFDIPEFSMEKVETLGENIMNLYIKCVYDERINDNLANSQLNICYTPLCGVGAKFMKKACEKYGFKNLHIVHKQEYPDGDFKTLLYPNPEYLPSFDLGLQLLEQKNANILIATDPDADRLGVAIKKQDKIYYLTGNQIAVIMLDYILKHRHIKNPDDVIISTVVSTKMVDKIASYYKIRNIKVLPGFKHIGEYLIEFQKNNALKNYIFSFEESLGYHKGHYTFDKDGILAAMLVIEICQYYYEKNKDLIDVLDELYAKYGYFAEKVVNISFDGLNSSEKMVEFMLQVENGVNIDGYNLINYKKLDKNVFEFNYENNITIIARPSGTEPKIKLYVNVSDVTTEKCVQKLNYIEKFLVEKYLIN